MDTGKLTGYIEKLKGELTDLSDYIFDQCELGNQEYHSCRTADGIPGCLGKRKRRTVDRIAV